MIKFSAFRTQFGTKGSFWAIADQILFAGTNFLVNLLLAYNLEPFSYGVFAVAYALLLLIGAVHTALFTEPLAVYGAGPFRENFRGYHCLLVRYNLRFSILGLFVIAIIVNYLGVSEMPQMRLGLLGLGFALPAVLYFWLVRRSAYALVLPHVATLGGGLYFVLYLGVNIFLSRINLLNEFNVFLSMAISSYLAAIPVKWFVEKGQKDEPISAKAVWQLHYQYGRWALLANLASWIPGNYYIFALQAFYDLNLVAEYKALTNFLMPVVNINMALMYFFLPLMVRHKETRERFRILLAQLRLQLAFALSLATLLATLHEPIMNLAYSGKYRFQPAFVAPFALNLLALGVMTALSTSLRAKADTKNLFRAWFLGSVFTLTFGTLLTKEFGIHGVLWASLWGNLLVVGYLAMVVRRGLRDGESGTG